MISLKPPPLRPVMTTVHQKHHAPHIDKICLVWTGDRYPAVYVEDRIKEINHYFEDSWGKALPDIVLFTDNHTGHLDGIEVESVAPGKGQGWWHKTQLFDTFDDGTRVLYFDLDVIIRRNLLTLTNAESSFCMIENFSPNRAQSAHNSSVMLWTQCDWMRDIHRQNTPEVRKALHGDQCWIWRVAQHHGMAIYNWPKSLIQSYKYHFRQGKMSPECAVLVFHGNPKPHEIKPDELFAISCQ